MNSIIKFFIFFICFIPFIMTEINPSFASIIIIVNNNVPVEELDSNTISDIYLGNISKWENGDTIRITMLKKGKTHEKFVQEIINVSSTRLKNFWKKIVFTGTGNYPKIIIQEDDLVNYVSKTKGAIGYINNSTSHDDVKVISIK